MPLRAWAKSRSLPLTVSVWLTAVVAAVAFGNTALGVPIARHPVPAPVLIVVAVTLLVHPPLQDRFEGLNGSLARTRLDRLLAVTVTATLALSLCLVATRRPGTMPLSLATLLAAASIAWTIVLGELAWLPALTTGMLVLVIDFAEGYVLSEASNAVGLPTALAALATAALTYVWLGPGPAR